MNEENLNENLLRELDELKKQFNIIKNENVNVNNKYEICKKENEELKEQIRILSSSSSAHVSTSKSSEELDSTDDLNKIIPLKKRKRNCSICRKEIVNLPRHLETKKHDNLSPQEKDDVMEKANLSPLFMNKFVRSSTDQSSSDDNKKTTKSRFKYTRRKLKSNVSCHYCDKDVENINDHLKTDHSLNDDEIEQYNLKFKQKKERKQYGDYRTCPECYKQFYRLDRHLINKHKSVPKSAEHLNLLREATKIKNKALMAEKRQKDRERALQHYQPDELDKLVETLDDDVGSVRIKEKDGIRNLFTTLDSFYKFLVSVSGKRIEESSAKAYKRYLWLLFQCINKTVNPKEVDVVWETDFTLENIQKCWFENERIKKFQPKTQQKVGYGIQHYLQFIKEQRLSKRLLNINSDQLNYLIQYIPDTIRNFNKDIKIREVMVRKEKSENAIKTEDIQKFTDSDEVKRIRKILEESKTKTDILSVQNYNLIQGYLILSTLIQSFNRIGAVTHMKVKEFLDAKQVQNYFRIEVSEHKTFHIHGNAKLLINKSLYSDYHNFYYEIRKRQLESINVESTPNSQMFLFPSTGNIVESSSASRFINNIWKRAGLTSRVTSTLLRTWISSNVFRNVVEVHPILKEMMCHREDTGIKYYVDQLKESKMAETRKYIAKKLSLNFLGDTEEEAEVVTDLLLNIAKTLPTEDEFKLYLKSKLPIDKYYTSPGETRLRNKLDNDESFDKFKFNFEYKEIDRIIQQMIDENKNKPNPNVTKTVKNLVLLNFAKNMNSDIIRAALRTKLELEPLLFFPINTIQKIIEEREFQNTHSDVDDDVENKNITDIDDVERRVRELHEGTSTSNRESESSSSESLDNIKLKKIDKITGNVKDDTISEKNKLIDEVEHKNPQEYDNDENSNEFIDNLVKKNTSKHYKKYRKDAKLLAKNLKRYAKQSYIDSRKFDDDTDQTGDDARNYEDDLDEMDDETDESDDETVELNNDSVKMDEESNEIDDDQNKINDDPDKMDDDSDKIDDRSQYLLSLVKKYFVPKLYILTPLLRHIVYAISRFPPKILEKIKQSDLPKLSDLVKKIAVDKNRSIQRVQFSDKQVKLLERMIPLLVTSLKEKKETKLEFIQNYINSTPEAEILLSFPLIRIAQKTDEMRRKVEKKKTT